MKKENALVFSLNKFSPTFSRGVGFGGVRLLSKPCWGRHVTRYSMLFGPPPKKNTSGERKKGGTAPSSSPLAPPLGGRCTRAITAPPKLAQDRERDFGQGALLLFSPWHQGKVLASSPQHKGKAVGLLLMGSCRSQGVH